MAIVSRIEGVPYFVNNDGAFIRYNLLKDAIKKFCFQGASLCFASGIVSKEYYMAYGVKQDRIRLHNFTSLAEEDILENLPTPEEKLQIRNEKGIRSDLVVVITVGQFIHRKGFDLLLKAWSQIAWNDKVHLYIIDGGSKRQEYEAFISENEMTNVSLIDFLPKQEIFQYYKASDIFVLPTREDVWGLVVNEAMAQGLPVISTDMCMAAKELVEDGVNGYIYAVEDTESLSQCLDRLIESPELRTKMGCRNIEMMKGKTMEAVGKQHIVDIENFFEQRGRKNE